MSKFMFHLRFSKEEDYLHKHELYEMLRSRNLYQIQFDLKKRLQKRIRAIELAEKVHAATFQSRKSLFLQDVQEKIKKRNRVSEPVVTEEPKHIFPGKRTLIQPAPMPLQDSDQRRSQTAPEVLQREFTDDDLEDPTENAEEIVTTRRSLSFCGKTFHVSKSASKSRTSISIHLERIDETGATSDGVIDETGATSDDVIDTAKVESDKDYNLVVEKDNPCDTNDQKNVAFSEEAISNRKKIVPAFSAPDISKLSMFESGVTTPDGRLILSREDYDEYMEKFRKATKQRLVKQRRQSETLSEKVRRFSIEG